MSKKPQYDPEEIRYPDQKITTSPLVPEMKQSFIEYAMSVIKGRALPDVRDGLKPVHRRILYAMYEDNLTSDKPFKKSATCVGDVLGRYHPHGDQSVYDALVRLAQDFSTRYLLVDGHGNFGSVDGDPPAAYRYTEARLSKLSNEMLRDIDKETVDWDPNFDESRKEPRVLPSRFPNLLVNGSVGIAVGMATNIPPHNLMETIDGVIAYIDNPKIKLAEMMKVIKGPDFPSGGFIITGEELLKAYETGKGKITLHPVSIRIGQAIGSVPVKPDRRIGAVSLYPQLNRALDSAYIHGVGHAGAGHKYGDTCNRCCHCLYPMLSFYSFHFFHLQRKFTGCLNCRKCLLVSLSIRHTPSPPLKCF